MATLSFKPQVIADSTGKWYDNALRFATEAEALANAHDLGMRWTAVREWRAAPSDDAPNYTYVDGELRALITMVVELPDRVQDDQDHCTVCDRVISDAEHARHGMLCDHCLEREELLAALERIAAGDPGNLQFATLAISEARAVIAKVKGQGINPETLTVEEGGFYCERCQHNYRGENECPRHGRWKTLADTRAALIKRWPCALARESLSDSEWLGAGLVRVTVTDEDGVCHFDHWGRP